MTINPQMIVLARESAGLTQTALAHAVGTSQASISKAEAGLFEPADDLLERMSKVCEVPTAFFSQLDRVVGEGLVDFFHKKRLTLPAKPLNKANAYANVVRLEAMRALRTLELSDVQPFPHLPQNQHGSPEEIARLVRATWRVPAGPLPDLVALIEATAVPVYIAPLGHEKLFAISMPGLQGRHVVILNGQLPALDTTLRVGPRVGPSRHARR